MYPSEHNQKKKQKNEKESSISSSISSSSSNKMSTCHYKERNKRKSHFSDYIHHRYHQPKCITLTSSFFVHLFIATTIVASQPDQSVAMNILNDRNDIHEEAQVLASVEMHTIVLNEKLSSHKSNAKGRSMAIPFKFGSDLLLAEDSDQSKSIRNTPNGPTCNCSNGKSANVLVSSCIQICNHRQHHRSQQQQQHEHQPKHSKKLKRKRKQNTQNHLERREHLTLIYGIDAISNNTEKSIVPIQSGEIMATKFRRRPTHRRTTTRDEKSSNNNNAREMNRHSRFQATYNLHTMAFQPDEHFVNLQTIDANNNRMKSSATQMQNIAVDNTVDTNYDKSVKRITRSIARKLLSTQSDEQNMTEWQVSVVRKTPLSATISTTIKSTVNGNFDSSTRRGGADEIIGSVAVGANRSSASTASSKYTSTVCIVSFLFKISFIHALHMVFICTEFNATRELNVWQNI